LRWPRPWTLNWRPSTGGWFGRQGRGAGSWHG